jgi:hypothetical protein
MNAGLQAQEREAAQAQELREFNIVIAYEDLAAGVRAKQTFDYLLAELGGRFTFTCKLWKFRILEAPQLSEIAAQDAAEADMIMVAAHGHQELPSAVRGWINLWLQRAGRRDRALVALVDSQDGDTTKPNPICSHLHEVAKRGNLDYFCHSADRPNQEASLTLLRIREQAARKSATLDGLPRQTAPHLDWGINE